MTEPPTFKIGDHVRQGWAHERTGHVVGVHENWLWVLLETDPPGAYIEDTADHFTLVGPAGDPEPPTCATCRFWWAEPRPNPNRKFNDTSPAARQSHFHAQNFCRRFPAYVNRHADDWCGEHTPKGETEG